jgi:dynein heavy chain 2
VSDILFVKRVNEPITPKNIRDNIDVHTLKGSPSANLLSSLRGIWCPLLAENSNNDENITSRVKQLLNDLEKSLRSTVAPALASRSDRHGSAVDLENVSGIKTLSDEMRFWMEMKRDSRLPSDLKDFVKKVDKDFESMNGVDDMSNIDIYSAMGLIDNCETALLTIWDERSSSADLNYPQLRMVHLLDCTGKVIFLYIQNYLANMNVWEMITSARDKETNGKGGNGGNNNSSSAGSHANTAATISSFRSSLQAAIQLIRRWCDVPKTVSRGTGYRSWRGDAYEDSLNLGYLTRLEQILEIFTIYDELLIIFNENERSTYRISHLFDAVQSQNPVIYNPYTNNLWERSMQQYEKLLEPIQAAVATKLRRDLSPYMNNVSLVLSEFQKYFHLMKRKAIKDLMTSERETLLTLCNEKLKNMESVVDREDYMPRENDRDGSNRDSSVAPLQGPKLTSAIVIGLTRLRQMKATVSEMQSSAKFFLDTLSGYEKFSSRLESLLSKLIQEENSKFNNWKSDIETRYEDNEDSFKLQGSLLSWKDGILVVNFPETLVKFLRDYRQLTELGYKVAENKERGSKSKRGSSSSSNSGINLQEIAIDGEKFYRFGMLLKKIANFYNSISEQIIDVQENLLLGSLSSFASLVTSNSSNTKKGSSLNWSNPIECETFIRTLQDAADKLAMENRSLRKFHEWLVQQAINLMNIDLHRSSEVWKSKWRFMKEKMTAIKSKYSEKDTKLWLLHWDHQIYKALEISYQLGLESLNENIPEIKIELVFNNKLLDFKPPLEQVRQLYYRECKKFINIPANFEGFSPLNNLIFKKMILRNSSRISSVYSKAETFFTHLMEYFNRYSEYSSLASLDLDAFLEANVKTSDEYLMNFKMLKLKRKEIDKLPDTEKIDCFQISLIPFKSFLDDFFLRMIDILLINLRRSLIEEFKEVDSFLTNAKEKLNSKPRTVDEIGDAKKQWKEFDSSKSLMQSLSKNCLEKKKLLLTYAPGTAIDISEIISKMSNLEGEGSRWDDFEVSLEAHNDIIEAQKEVLKTFLEEEEMNLNIEIEKFFSKWKQLKPSDNKSWDYKDIQRVFDSLDDWKKQFSELEARTAKHFEARVNFNMKSPRFDNLEFLQQDILNTSKSWDMLKEYLLEEKKLSDEDWLTFTNIYDLQDFAVKWSDNLKQTFTRGSYDSVAEYIMNKVEKMKKSIPALKYCKSDAFKEDHWTELLQGKLMMSKDLRVEKLKVEHFLAKLDILMDPSTLSFVKSLQARALGEVQIREAMHELRAWELSAELTFLTQEESGRSIPLIKEWKDLFLEIGDKQSLLSSLKESPFFKAFADVGLALEAKMTALDYILHTLNSIQRKWVYLEPIFARGALPTEESRFRRVDESFKDIMNTIIKDPKLFYLADESYFPKISDNLRFMLDQLERCQKALTEFLEAKRSSMPRFYFIGDDDLLEILGQAKNPTVIQSHLKKLFQGIHKVKFDADNKHIMAMVSSSNEIVELENPVKISEKVEDWLEQLAQEMRATLSSLLTKCLMAKQFDWKYPSQILCLSQAIKFTQQAEAAVEGGGLKALKSLQDQLKSDLKEFTSHDLSSEPLLQLKMKSLVMDLVHNLDVIDQLLDKKVQKLSDWIWSKQLRYYYVKNAAVVRMHDAEFEYTYEYQGNAPKLVHTPLTDRCYLTLTQGMKMGFGGNPYGPAGTGKTESVKALASCLGRQVLVFNCDEALESTSMIRIFIGIVKCGAWGCFDEFNRLKEDQLSAISQQIQIIQDAIKTRSSPITLLGRSIDVNFNSGIFVTLNPAGKGYGGRSRLPDNLKALFRPVAMGAPDNELIAEVSLVTEGFTQAKDLASKIVSLFRLSKQLLSTQQHYDWGLRALKAVLNSGGRLIQSYKVQGSKVDNEIEYEILIKAVRVNTLSKLTFNDTMKFLALIGDVFPGIKSADITGGELEQAIKDVMKEKPFHLVEDYSQIKKMIQLKESMDQRMGCVIVGPSGSGKSTLWRVLKAAMIK